ncbi:kinase-like domain-containing protein [Hygrophoropsis aurantiaca]|uniref:Kinase-like domain-containing protein n=1 Tax=Hygrophoropsis aurantiaca TaxID=72124 RepID=A0ACB7ZSS5_9AGAM|nr:kinase-like domain-containing protein [Hygrophoropsis aurantiaca]
MFRRIRLLRVQSSSLRLATHRKFSTTHRIPEPKTASMSVERAIPFTESVISVRVREEEPEDGGEEGVFTSDEEPHFLKPELGFGFNPLKLGAHLNGGLKLGGSYEIVRKLGFGANSSVWLVKFSNNPTTEKQFLAVKVLTVNITAGNVYDKHWELSSARRVAGADPNHPGYQHCLTLRDSFVCTSYHGPHTSLVFDVLGSDMLSLQRAQPNRAFSLHVTKRIIKQVLLALDYIHSVCGLVHRDVKPQNIMVSMNVPYATIADYLNKNPAALYEPRIEPDLSADPIITVKSQPLPDFDLDPTLDNLVIKLADYGEAIALNKIDVEDECQPVLLRAPEVILGHSWSTPIDIWSVGCIVFEHLTGSPFFKLYESPSVCLADSHLRRMIEHLGDFPSSFLALCSRRNAYFDEKGNLLRVKQLFPQTIEQCIAPYKRVENQDIAAAAAFIRRCLTIDPSVRPSASELLQDEWLSDV